MPAFAGSFELRSAAGVAQQAGSCRIALDEESLQLVPGTGSAVAADLGDIDEIAALDYGLELKLYDGSAVRLFRFGSQLQNLRHDLLESWRRRLIRCLLVEDRDEIARVEGVAALDSADGILCSPAEIRLYRRNLAVFPASGAPFQWRLAEIDALDFDEAAYALVLSSGRERLVLTKLARKTREFAAQLSEATGALAERSARVIRAVFPFLSVEGFRQVAALWKEGRALPLARFAAVHPSAAEAIEHNCVGGRARPCFDFLKERAAGVYAAYKFVRKEEAEEGDEAAEEKETGTGGGVAEAAERPLVDAGDESLLFWFFLPVRSAASQSGCADLAAWECTSLAGRATYFFRLPSAGGADEAVSRLSRAMAVLNFRREPVYIADRSLELEPRYRCYALAKRKIPVLRELRDSFCGRAVHTSLGAWQRQVESILQRSR
mgnify:CR=1 FL=1